MVRRDNRGLGEILQSVPKPFIFLLLIIAASAPLFANVLVPNKPVEPSIDFYAQLMDLKEGDRVLVGSDWTNSTRGESSGEFEALMKILMRKGVKFAVYSTGDVQAPEVARVSIAKAVADQKLDGYREYKPFEDYVILGFSPNSEGTNTAINNDFRQCFSGRKDSPPGAAPKDVFQSPVLKDVKQVSDFKLLVLVTASATNRITVERVTKVPLMFMVTGVQVPENQSLYASGQLLGLIGGVKGVYDLELLMEKGLLPVSAPGPLTMKSKKYPEGLPGFPGKHNAGNGTRYNLALHFTIGLLILAVIVGNVGMFLSRKRSA